MWLGLLKMSLLILLIAFVPHRTVAQEQLLPGAWPLAVKNPYLNSWFQAGPEPAPLNESWPRLWSSSITGWYCNVVVDDIPYRLMGEDFAVASNSSIQSPPQITPTRTIIEFRAGPVNITLTFLSSISTNDLTRQSLPFSYFFVTAISADGSSHTVKVYSDISAEWIAGNTSVAATTMNDIESDFVILQASLKEKQPFLEIDNVAQDAQVLYSTRNDIGVHYEVGVDDAVRNASINTSGLQNTIDPNVSDHPVDSPFDTWGISVDLGQVTNMTSPAVWAIGVTRDPAIQFSMLSDDVQLRSSYYQMNFSTPHDMVSFFLNDFDNALNASSQLDIQIMTDATTISAEYYELLSLISRQAMSALEITISKDVNGNFNSSDVMAFLKNMGSVSGGGVNAVDLLYAAFPIFLYLDPTIGGHLLNPLLVSQDIPQYTQPYAAQGLGHYFPIASVQNLSHDFGIEQSGNMIIMILAHLQASGDSTLVKRHYSLIKGWADYLVQNSLSPSAQQSPISDGITANNQTNLALKGIIGIAAMARISSFMGLTSDSVKYGHTAETYIMEWQTLSLSLDQTHILTSYGQESSAGLIYNMYADRLLQLNLIPQSVYEVQSAFYSSQLGMKTQPSESHSTLIVRLKASNSFGIPLDSISPTNTRADWMMFAGAATGDIVLLRSFISKVHSYAFTSISNTSLSPVYDPTSGNSFMGLNSPALGGLFAPLALKKPLLTKINTSSLTYSNETWNSQISNAKTTVVHIAAAVAGGFTLLALIVVALTQYKRRRDSLVRTLFETRKGASQNRKLDGLVPFILPSEPENHEIRTKDILARESPDQFEVDVERFSLEVQVPEPSTRGKSLASDWSDWRRDVTRFGREIGRILGDARSESPSPPSYISNFPN